MGCVWGGGGGARLLKMRVTDRAPFPPFSPSLISLMVSVDVKHHVHSLTDRGTETERVTETERETDTDTQRDRQKKTDRQTRAKENGARD